jgi:nucleoside-diphosphate-sugar epimerase
MCRDALQKNKIYVHGGEQIRDFVYVDDVVNAILKHPDGLWSVRTGGQFAVSTVAEILAGLSGAEIVVQKKAGVYSSVDDAPRVEMDYMPLKEGLRKTYEWFELRAANKWYEERRKGES